MTHALPRLTDTDIRLLRVFRAIVECNGFTQAGVELGMSRSTVSTHMTTLESRLGFRLCQRGRAGFALTERGLQVFDAVVRLMTTLEEFRSDIGIIGGRVVGQLNLGLVDNIVSDPNRLIARTLSSFCASAPEVHVVVQVVSPNEISRGLLDGQFHVGISPDCDKHGGLSLEPLYEERISLYCGKGHKFFDIPNEEITVEETSDLSCVRPGYTINRAQNVEFHGPGMATAYHAEGVAHLILTGNYVGYLPEHFAERWVTCGDMRPLKQEEFSYSLPFSIVTSLSQNLRTPVLLFLEELRKEANLKTGDFA